LTGGFQKVVILKMGYSFFQGLGTVGGRLVIKEGDLRCSKVHRVDDAVHMKSVKESP
jgi:hypothetical protein